MDFNDGNGPQHRNGLVIVLYMLSKKFSPLDYENNVRAAQTLLTFAMQQGETIDAALCRFDTVRYKAQQEANLDLGPTGTAFQLLMALRIPAERWTLLLQPFGGNMPRDEAELTQLQEHIRRQGHIMEGVLTGPTRQGYVYNWTLGDTQAPVEGPVAVCGPPLT